jgi:hypothetical protein
MKRLLLAIWLSIPVLVHAQSGNSIITGTVKDASEAAIAAARVQIVNIDTGVNLAIVTNGDGIYRAGSLAPGNYRVEVDATGFEHLTRGPVVVQVSQTLGLDLTLQVGAQSLLFTFNN